MVRERQGQDSGQEGHWWCVEVEVGTPEWLLAVARKCVVCAHVMRFGSLHQSSVNL